MSSVIVVVDGFGVVGRTYVYERHGCNIVKLIFKWTTLSGVLLI